MAHVQTSYRRTHAQAVAGQLANTDNVRIDSYEVAAGQTIGFGLAVKRAGAAGADARRAALGMDVNQFLGVSVQDRTLPPMDDDAYTAGKQAGVLSQGDIWVQVDGAVVAGQNVTVTEATGEFGTKPVSTTPGSEVTAVAGAVWMTSAADNGLAILRVGQASVGAA